MSIDAQNAGVKMQHGVAQLPLRSMLLVINVLMMLIKTSSSTLSPTPSSSWSLSLSSWQSQSRSWSLSLSSWQSQSRSWPLSLSSWQSQSRSRSLSLSSSQSRSWPLSLSSWQSPSTTWANFSVTSNSVSQSVTTIPLPNCSNSFTLPSSGLTLYPTASSTPLRESQCRQAPPMIIGCAIFGDDNAANWSSMTMGAPRSASNTFAFAFDALFNDGGEYIEVAALLISEWSLQSIIQLESKHHILFSVATAGSPRNDGTCTIAIRLNRSESLHLEPTRPFALQRCRLEFEFLCAGNLSDVNSVIAIIEVVPRPLAIPSAIVAAAQGTQAISLLSGDASALSFGRLAASLALLKCGESYGDDWSGSSIFPVNIGNGVVNTIVGNLVFVAAGILGLLLWAALVVIVNFQRENFVPHFHSVLNQVFRFPSVVFLLLAPTLSTTVAAVTVHFASQNRFFLAPLISSVSAVCVWGGYCATLLVLSYHCRDSRVEMIKIDERAHRGAIGLVQAAIRRRSRWLHSDRFSLVCRLFAPLFDDVTVVWFMPLDCFVTAACSAVGAVPPGTSGCAAVAATQVALSAIMLLVGVTRVFCRTVHYVSNVLLQICVVGSAIGVLFAIVDGVTTGSGAQGSGARWAASAEYFVIASLAVSFTRSIVDGVVLVLSVHRNAKRWKAAAQLQDDKIDALPHEQESSQPLSPPVLLNDAQSFDGGDVCLITTSLDYPQSEAYFTEPDLPVLSTLLPTDTTQERFVLQSLASDLLVAYEAITDSIIPQAV